MKNLLRNQWRLLRQALSWSRFLVKASIYTARKDLRAVYIQRTAYRRIIDETVNKSRIIAELESSAFPQEHVRISFAAAIRYIDNPNSRLDLFLDSLVSHADDLNRIEVLLMIDSDDDLEYFLKLKRRFGSRVRLCIFVSPQRFGYEKLHIYDKLLFKKISPAARMIGDYSDDVTITRKGFDTQLLEIDARYPDNIYFIHTRHTNRDEWLGDVSKELFRLYWVMQAVAPASYVPLFSRRVLELAEQALIALPEGERDDWSPYANTWICDCYIDAISTMVRAKGFDRIIQLDMMRVSPVNLYAGHQHNRDRNNLSPSDRAIITLVGNHTRSHIDTIATYIADAIYDAQQSVMHVQQETGAAA